MIAIPEHFDVTNQYLSLEDEYISQKIIASFFPLVYSFTFKNN